MPTNKRSSKGPAHGEWTDEHEREFRRRAKEGVTPEREGGEKILGEDDIHAIVRQELYKASQEAPKTLKREMRKGGKGAVAAATVALDRTGHPPTKKVLKEEQKQRQGTAIEQALAELAEIPDDLLLPIMAHIIQQKPGFLEKAKTAAFQAIEEDVIDIEPTSIEERNSASRFLEEARVTIGSHNIGEQDGTKAAGSQDHAGRPGESDTPHPA